MKTAVILFNHKASACGVYQYGKRAGTILKESSCFEFIYIEVGSRSEVEKAIEKYKPILCIFNHNIVTMPWLRCESLGVKCAAIMHDTAGNGFDFYIDPDPKREESGTIFNATRPSFKFDPQPTSKARNKIAIGSFGFGFSDKGFDKICKLVNNEFDEAIINLHITFSHFCSNGTEQEQIKNRCKSAITKPDIELNITNNFIDDETLLCFLSLNDINIFAYDEMPNRGPSSVLDYAVSVEKPIGLSDSDMFRHVLCDYRDQLSIETNSISSLANGAIDHILKLKKEWSHQNFISSYENLVEKLLKNEHQT
jgi:hypothetical protein|tara:strand:- start:2564 stop:3493 length:930 start_codon:yes stop_codon:yes gene_type:complete